jgi:hypothetical protein
MLGLAKTPLFLADALHKRGYSCSIICDKPLDEIFKESDNYVNNVRL